MPPLSPREQARVLAQHGAGIDNDTLHSIEELRPLVARAVKTVSSTLGNDLTDAILCIVAGDNLTREHQAALAEPLYGLLCGFVQIDDEPEVVPIRERRKPTSLDSPPSATS